MIYATVNSLLDESVYEGINQVRRKKKQCLGIEGIYDYMMKVVVLVDMQLSFRGENQNSGYGRQSCKQKV